MLKKFVFLVVLLAMSGVSWAESETPPPNRSSSGRANVDDFPPQKYPRRWQANMRRVANWPTFFECDFTSGKCMDGWRVGTQMVARVLAPDRKTVVDHISCSSYYGLSCMSFDTGDVWDENRKLGTLNWEDGDEY